MTGRLAALIAMSVLAGGAVVMLGGGCGAISARDESSSAREFPLNQLPTTKITIGDETLTVWLATTAAQRNEGLMHVTDDQLGDDEGMLFVFPQEQFLSFWMKNTLIPLDIAYARTDGTVVTIHQMPPLTLNNFPSYEPARFALEMKAGAFARLGIREGAALGIPADVLKPDRSSDE